MPIGREQLNDVLGAAARAAGADAVVVADQEGLLIADSGASEAEAVAAVAALRATGSAARSDVVDGRVKAHEVQVGDDTVVLGTVGDTAIASAVFDRVEWAVQQGLSSH